MREWFSFDMTGQQLMNLNDHICCIFAFSLYSTNKKKRHIYYTVKQLPKTEQ